MLPFRNNNRLEKFNKVEKSVKKEKKTLDIDKITFETVSKPKQSKPIIISDTIIEETRKNTDLQKTFMDNPESEEPPLLTESIGIDSIYPINHFLSSETIDSKKIKKQVNLIVYKITVSNQHPFIEFMLIRNGNSLDFLSLSNIKGNIETSIIDKLKKQTNNCTFKVKGLLDYNSTSNIFVECSSKDTNKIYKDISKVAWVIPYEIVNPRKVCDLDISISVSNFFADNPKIFQLYSDSDMKKTFESPIVLYYGDHENKIMYCATFGIDKKVENNFLGSFYYFSDYHSAIDESNANSEDSKSVAVLRTVVFPGKKTLYLTNKTDKEIQENSKWYKNYTSVYIGPIKGRNMTFVMKDYEQQQPYSLHKINK